MSAMERQNNATSEGTETEPHRETVLKSGKQNLVIVQASVRFPSKKMQLSARFHLSLFRDYWEESAP